MEVINKIDDFDSLKYDIEKTKNKYINNKIERENIKNDYIRQRNLLINYIDTFDDLSKKDIMQKIIKAKDKEELEFNKRILKEYKKIITEEVFVETIINSEDIITLLKKDYSSLKYSMLYKVSCVIIPVVQIMITLSFNYGILFFPYNDVIKYLLTIIQLYIPAFLFDYIKECIKEDIEKIYDLKYTLKEENKTIVK